MVEHVGEGKVGVDEAILFGQSSNSLRDSLADIKPGADRPHSRVGDDRLSLALARHEGSTPGVGGQLGADVVGRFQHLGEAT